MKKYVFCILLFVTHLLISCKKDNPDPHATIYGSYEGTYYVYDIKGGKVKLNIGVNTFSGSAIKGDGVDSTGSVPRICAGKIKISTDSLIFTDECTWTADFSSQSILNGSFAYKTYGDTLYFIGKSPSTEEYILIKK